MECKSYNSTLHRICLKSRSALIYKAITGKYITNIFRIADYFLMTLFLIN